MRENKLKDDKKYITKVIRFKYFCGFFFLTILEIAKSKKIATNKLTHAYFIRRPQQIEYLFNLI